jgi:16S rRNA (uracil1498-N3)-methyltransferase
MMGVRAIEPLVTEHTAVRLKALSDGRATDRWRRIAIASAKQCRRAVLPIIGEGTDIAEWIAQDTAEAKVILVEPAAAPDQAASTIVPARPASASLMIGPEGGWSRAEVDLAVGAGCTPMTLGRRTLRADAVALIALAVLQHGWGDL